MMRFSHIEAFRAVMVSGSTTAAARMLNTSQPNVSRSIAQLEKNTGLTLFERLPGKVVPTQDGYSFYNEVQRSYVGLQRLEDAAKRIHRFSRGILRIAAVQTLAQGLIPRTIARFSEIYPEVSISIHAGHSTAVAQWIDEQFCDLGVVSFVGSDYRFERELVYEVDGVCIVPAGHRLAGNTRIVPEDLSGESFISFPQNEYGRSVVDKVFDEAGVTRHISLETSYSSIICSLVGLGRGVAIVNPIVAQDFKHLPIVIRPFSPAVKHAATSIFAKGRTQNRLVTSFAALLNTVAGEEQARLSASHGSIDRDEAGASSDGGDAVSSKKARQG